MERPPLWRQRYTINQGRLAAIVAATRAEAAAIAAARAVLTRTRLVHRQRAALELAAVEAGDRLVAAFRHLDEAEAARAAGVAIHHHLGPRHTAELPERFEQVVG